MVCQQPLNGSVEICRDMDKLSERPVPWLVLARAQCVVRLNSGNPGYIAHRFAVQSAQNRDVCGAV